MVILGISCYFHDSAACIVDDGKIVAACQEERFSRKKNDSNFPTKAIKFCLNKCNLDIKKIDKIVFYENSEKKYKRILYSYKAFFPKSIPLIIKTFFKWNFKKRHYLKTLNSEFLKNFDINIGKNKFFFFDHHLSHAASAFHPSPYEESTILIMDGVGEFNTTSIWKGNNQGIKLIKKIDFPHSIGLLYSAFTYFCGFKMNNGEYKLMGLAPYGRPIFVDTIKNNLINIEDNGFFTLNMKYFCFPYSSYMLTNKFFKLFKTNERTPESNIDQIYLDIAASIQKVVEEIVIKLSSTAVKLTKSSNLCLAGGVALNCVANGKILSSRIVKNLWIQPASGDAGASLGAALHYSFLYDKKFHKNNLDDFMKGSYLGPEYSDLEVKKYLNKIKANYSQLNFKKISLITAKEIKNGKIIGWFQGRSEFGPRALGNRSILGDARNPKMQKNINLKIKFRENFRPFAPAVLEEDIENYFKLKNKSPYMLIVTEIRDDIKIKSKKKYKGLDKLKILRSKIPSVTHVDFSARVQTVSKNTNEKFYQLINDFKSLTGDSLIINTSFNIRGEPIVCSPEDAFNCFIKTNMDILVINNFILFKENQKNNNIQLEE